MDVLSLLWPVLFGGLVTPLTTWVKSVIPASLPIGSEFISLALALVFVLPLKVWLTPDAPWIEIMALVLGADKLSQIGHERVSPFIKGGK